MCEIHQFPRRTMLRRPEYSNYKGHRYPQRLWQLGTEGEYELVYDLRWLQAYKTRANERRGRWYIERVLQAERRLSWSYAQRKIRACTAHQMEKSSSILTKDTVYSDKQRKYRSYHDNSSNHSCNHHHRSFDILFLWCHPACKKKRRFDKRHHSSNLDLDSCVFSFISN